MATLRSDITIDRPADEVWAVVSDAGRISEWMPAVLTSTANGNVRSCELEGGVPLEEEIVTNDPGLRRFQYRIVGGGVPADTHLGTVDVHALDDGRSLVVYGTEITPDDLAGTMGPALEDGVRGLKEYCERR
ncbi:SRPBCC family protein [Geodermatophilus chilensis]|jgi:carbon monoxide dehydrogenase subunit G|uniref:SRPBCC family protein n=1 Tax=Geodermatophilus chilensis TaxID=2035835 RepID=UPI000C26184E|nr:SRPBCC family protein [Geodermatophilus chilensis]